MPKKYQRKQYTVQLYVRINRKLVPLSPTGFRGFPQLTWNEVTSLLRFFFRARHLVRWAIGDLIHYARETFGASSTFAAELSDGQHHQPDKIAKASAAVPHQYRAYKINPKVQYVVWTMDDKDTAKEILQRAMQEGWSIKRIIETREQFSPPVDRGLLKEL